MAQHRQACLARWPGHQGRTQKLGGEEELTGVLTEEHGGRPWRQHDGAASVVVARPPSRSCTNEEAATCSRPSGRAQHGGGGGVAVAVQPTRRRGDHHQHRQAREGAPASSPEYIKPLGQDLLGRSSTAMAAIGGGGNETPRSRGRVQRGKAEAPEGGGGSRRSRARRASATRIARGELGLGFRPRGGESEGAAGPSQAGSVKPPGWTDWWAQAVSRPFYF
jgi:hypothetical protein